MNWIKQHQVLVIGILLIASLLFLGNKWLNSSARDADRRVAVAEAALAEQKKANAEQIKFYQDKLDKYSALVIDMSAKNDKLVAAIAARDKALHDQQNVNNTLPLPELAMRWSTLAALNETDLKATNDGITVSDNAARKTVNLLEAVPVLEADLKTKDEIIQNKDIVISEANSTLATCNQTIGGLKKQIDMEQSTCKDQKDSLKADARKSKRNWFLFGVGVGIGITAGIVAHF